MAVSTLDSRSRQIDVRDLLGRIWPGLFFVVMFSGFAIGAWVSSGANMFSPDAVQGILLFSTLILLLAAAETFVILTAGIDLSVGFILGLASVVSALVMGATVGSSLPAFVVLLLGLASSTIVGLAAGLVNGWLIAKINVPSFIATLGMGGVVFGLALLLADGQPVAGLPKFVGQVGNSFIVPDVTSKFGIEGGSDLIPVTVVATAIVVFAVGWLLKKTQFGWHVYAFGGNSEAAKRAGVNVDLLLMKVYALAGALSGFGGFLFTLRFSTGNPRAGETILLTAIAAVVIGGASLFGGEGKMLGTIIGALTVAIIDFGLVFVRVEPYWQWIAVGVVVILSVIVDQLSIGKRAGS